MLLASMRRKAARKKSNREWQHVGLVAGYLAGRHFIGAKDLHYGYWDEGLNPSIADLPRAQSAYTEFLIKHIPWTSRKVLDVGSGAGSLAEKLISRGHSVDCVSPCLFLNEQARERLGVKVRMYDCRYEDFEAPFLYDTIVFGESFQYVDMATALSRAAWQLIEGSRIVICDFFQKDTTDPSPISGGHRLKDFWEVVSRYPFRVIRDLDITAKVSPTFTVIDQVFQDVLQPIWIETRETFNRTHPLWAKWTTWWFRTRMNKFETKYFTGSRTADNFEAFKSYRLIVLERTAF